LGNYVLGVSKEYGDSGISAVAERKEDYLPWERPSISLTFESARG